MRSGRPPGQPLSGPHSLRGAAEGYLPDVRTMTIPVAFPKPFTLYV